MEGGVLVEILSGVVCVLLFLRFNLTPEFFIFWYLLSALTVVSFVDLRFQEIPDEITLSGIILGLLAAALYPPLMGKVKILPSLLVSFLGMIAGGGSIYALGFLGEFIFKKEAMGGGDVKLAAMIGAFLGWKYIVISLFFGFFLGALAGILLIILKIKNREDAVPFGPFIVLGSFITLLWGEKILSWYLVL